MRHLIIALALATFALTGTACELTSPLDDDRITAPKAQNPGTITGNYTETLPAPNPNTNY